MIIRGPFTIKWGDNAIEDIESISVEHSIASDDYETVNGRVFELDGAYKMTISITLLSTDIPSLAVLLPQYFVPYLGVLSSGETVQSSAGAIDVVPDNCYPENTYGNLDIISCGNPGQILRLINARSKIESIEYGKVQKITVKLIGEPLGNSAVFQFVPEDYEYPDNFFMLDDNDFFLLDVDGQLIV